MKRKQYNHMFDVAFTVVSKEKDPYKVPPEELLKALQARIDYLVQHPEECAEAFGHSDSYEVP